VADRVDLPLVRGLLDRIQSCHGTLEHLVLEAFLGEVLVRICP
jgi:hypothetical protein